jgi:hypothetical protein
MPILHDGRGKTPRQAGDSGIETMEPLHRTLSVVPTVRDEIDLFPLLPPHISDLEICCIEVERITPGIPQPDGVNLRATALFGKGVIRRDRVQIAMVHIDP